MVIHTSNIMIDRENFIIYVDQKARQFVPSRGKKNAEHGHHSLFFAACQHLILNGWTKRSDLMDFLYGADPDGGPIGGETDIDIHVCRWNIALESLGLIIQWEKRGGAKWFKIERMRDV